MNTLVQEITLQGLMLAFIPSAIVIAILFHWRANAGTAAYATLRMLIQLLLIGYVLVYIFETEHFAIILAVLTVMLLVASWIAIRPLRQRNRHAYGNALIAITISGLTTLALVSQVILSVEPWFSPRYVVPLAGMIFAGAMNAVSLAAERYQSECGRGVPHVDARRTALQTALIPITNSLFAVGLVSLPGMMTGQILSGVSPLVAVKYQIVVMTMLFGVSGMAAALYLLLEQQRQQSTPDAQAPH